VNLATTDLTYLFAGVVLLLLLSMYRKDFVAWVRAKFTKGDN